MRPVVSGKLAYIRFDRNSYSIPHTHVRQPLTPLATARLVVGAAAIAQHARSYDTGVTIEDPTHLDALLAEMPLGAPWRHPPVTASSAAEVIRRRIAADTSDGQEAR